MLTIGPCAYLSNRGIQWLQITIGDNGVCTEFQQASEAGFINNTWRTLEPEQWPTTISAFDPSISQSHFMLSRDSANKLSRHLFTEYTPPKTADGQNQAPIDRVTSQTYLGNQLGPITILQNPQTKAGLLAAKWRPDKTQEAALKAQYHQWEQSQLTNWHHDTAHPELSMPNSPLDFQTTHMGVAKPAIETDLVPGQQWVVKSIIQERLGLLKAESLSSEEYRNALHFLIDGTEPSSPIAEATQKNIEDIKPLISASGINRYMKQNFYTKIIDQMNTRSQSVEKIRVNMTETDPGYDVTIESVRSYIQQLMLAEIQQYFPDYSIIMAEQPANFVSTFKVGALPIAQAGAIEESSTGLSQQEIRQIDHLYRVHSGAPLWDNSEESLAEMSAVIGSIQNRFAATQAVASTFRLLIPNDTDWDYETALEHMAEKVQKTLRLKQLFRSLLAADEDYSLRSFNSQEYQQLGHDITFLSTHIQSYPAQEQQSLVIRLFQKEILSSTDTKRLIIALSEEVPSFERSLIKLLADTLPHPESEQYLQLYAVLTGEMILDLNTPDTVLQNLSQIVNDVGPRAAASKQFLEFLTMLRGHSLSVVKTNISGHFLAKKIIAYFDEPKNTRSQVRLNAILPNIAELPNWLDRKKASAILRATLTNLTAEQQTQVLITFFTQNEVPSDVAKDLFGESSPLEFKVMLDVMTALSIKQMSVLVNNSNALFVLRTLLYKYEESSSRKPKEFLRELSDEMLDKLMPQISVKSIQRYLDDYDLKLEELPKANTADWEQTASIITSLFAKTKAASGFIEQLRSATSPRALKELLFLEISNGFYYQAQNMVAIALQRLSEHETAIVHSLAPEDRRWHIQLKSCGELGKCLALELECLLRESQGAGKLNQLKDALNRLPEKISEAELYGQLRDTHSALSTALFTSAEPVARGLKLFEQKISPEPDMVFLREINARLERLDQTLATGVGSQSLTNRGI